MSCICRFFSLSMRHARGAVRRVLEEAHVEGRDAVGLHGLDKGEGPIRGGGRGDARVPVLVVRRVQVEPQDVPWTAHTSRKVNFLGRRRAEQGTVDHAQTPATNTNGLQ